jgi:quinol monooxygenase YgiN
MKKTLPAEFSARPGCEEYVAELVKDYFRQVREEPGNLAFEVYTEQQSDPLTYWIFEVYADEAAFQAHLAASYGALSNAELQQLINEKESVLTFLSPLDIAQWDGHS